MSLMLKVSNRDYSMEICKMCALRQNTIITSFYSNHSICSKVNKYIYLHFWFIYHYLCLWRLH